MTGDDLLKLLDLGGRDETPASPADVTIATISAAPAPPAASDWR